MKKNISIKNYWTSIIFLGIIGISILFTSCKDDDSLSGPITINKIFLEDVNASVTDREVTFGRLGQLLRIEGSGFTSLKKVYINGFSTYFNPVYVSDNSLLINISKDTPIVDAEESVRNTISMSNDNYDTTFPFIIRSSAPTISRISNTLPQAGETITIYGTGLIEVSKVVFPGDIIVTSGITANAEGEDFTVLVPDGISNEGGSIFIECANGGAYSPAYFNFKKGVILDFDANGTHGFWSDATSMIMAEDIASTSIGENNVSQANYVPHRPTRIASFDPASNRLSEVWTAGNDVDDWRGQLTPYIPATTPLDKVAFQFDIYVPNTWEATGFLKICLVNGFNGGEWDGACYNYVPWLIEEEIEPFQTTAWTTVTIPLNQIYSFSDGDFTFEDILAYREAANYKNFGVYFENSDIKLQDVTGNSSEVEFISTATAIDVYTDNWRIVSLETPDFSDFPD